MFCIRWKSIDNLLYFAENFVASVKFIQRPKVTIENTQNNNQQCTNLSTWAIWTIQQFNIYVERSTAHKLFHDRLKSLERYFSTVMIHNWCFNFFTIVQTKLFKCYKWCIMNLLNKWNFIYILTYPEPKTNCNPLVRLHQHEHTHMFLVNLF